MWLFKCETDMWGLDFVSLTHNLGYISHVFTCDFLHIFMCLVFTYTHIWHHILQMWISHMNNSFSHIIIYCSHDVTCTFEQIIQWSCTPNIFLTCNLIICIITCGTTDDHMCDACYFSLWKAYSMLLVLWITFVAFTVDILMNAAGNNHFLSVSKLAS